MARRAGSAGSPEAEALGPATERKPAADAFETTQMDLVGEQDRPERPGSHRTRSSIVIGRFQGTVVVTVHGELDVIRAAHLGSILSDLIDGQGNLSITVDLHDATASDADSLWVFSEAAERARRRGGTIRLNEPPAPLHQGLQLRGVDHFVTPLLE